MPKNKNKKITLNEVASQLEELGQLMAKMQSSHNTLLMEQKNSISKLENEFASMKERSYKHSPSTSTPLSSTAVAETSLQSKNLFHSRINLQNNKWNNNNNLENEQYLLDSLQNNLEKAGRITLQASSLPSESTADSTSSRPIIVSNDLNQQYTQNNNSDIRNMNGKNLREGSLGHISPSTDAVQPQIFLSETGHQSSEVYPDSTTSIGNTKLKKVEFHGNSKSSDAFLTLGQPSSFDLNSSSQASKHSLDNVQSIGSSNVTDFRSHQFADASGVNLGYGHNIVMKYFNYANIPTFQTRVLLFQQMLFQILQHNKPNQLFQRI